jgi:hypothetical protein
MESVVGWSRAPRVPLPAALAILGTVLALALTGIAAARMQSTRLAPGLCETTGGGRFVDIPGFPGEMIDRRLLTDVRRLVRRYKIFITDGYSLSDVHAVNGEHPLGLALDIIPDRSRGGTWATIDRLAAWAEPQPNEPRQPFRWVGYDGDPNHGRGHHLHLSWSHSMSSPGRAARTVYTMRCPSPAVPLPEPAPTPAPEPPPLGGGTQVGQPVKEHDGVSGGGHGGSGHGGSGGRPSGPGSGGIGGGGLGSGSGGVPGKVKLAPAVAETGGVGSDLLSTR